MRTSTLPGNRNKGMIGLYVRVMCVAMGLAVSVALLVTRTGPQYSASAEILIGPTITPSGNYIQPSMPTEQRVATSAEVLSAAAAQLGLASGQPLKHLSVTVPVDTQIVVMTYTADTPAAALSGAKAFAEAYLRTRNPSDGKDPVASLVSSPELPSVPVGINYPVVLGAAVLAGLLIGFAVAWAWDRVRGRIRTIDDAERTAGLDALAVAPRLLRTPAVRDQRVGAGGPQLDSLAARVLGQVEGGQRPRLLVTSAAIGCGGTGVAVLTALALARMGQVVVLVTADDGLVARMSRDRDPRRGSDGLDGDSWLDVRATKEEGLHLVSVAEWDVAGIAAARLASLFPELHQRLPEALVVIDGPPAWRSAGLTLHTDKILLVVALGRCSRTSVAAAVQGLSHCAEKMMGLVITPRRAHVRQWFVSARAWVFVRTTRIMFRIGPPSGGFAPMSTRRPRSIPHTPRDWTASVSLDEHRSGDGEPDRMGTVVRLPQPPPSGEPTSTVVS